MREIVIRLVIPDGVDVRFDDEPNVKWPSSDFPPPQEIPVVRTIATEQPHPIWQVGQVHAPGHNPLKSNARGLFCPSKVDGEWCKWRP